MESKINTFGNLIEEFVYSIFQTCDELGGHDSFNVIDRLLELRIENIKSYKLIYLEVEIAYLSCNYAWKDKLKNYMPLFNALKDKLLETMPAEEVRHILQGLDK